MIEERADEWASALRHHVVTSGGRWIEPLEQLTDDGYVMFEWWNRRRKVTVYVGPDSIDYVQVWGSNMMTEMGEGSAEPLGRFLPVWSWLTE